MGEARVTAEIVHFLVGADIRAFPDEVIRQGKRCLVDGLGVILAGSTTNSGRIVREHASAFAGLEEATTLGADSRRVPASLAALANGTSGHALDFDDTQLSKHPGRMYGLLTHPTIPPLCATLAVGERLSASGSRMLEAFLTGIEVECKIAEAIDPSHYKRGFHTSATCGTFGAAAATAKLLGLDGKRAARAVGIAASMAGGIRANFGSMTKPLHVGRAAENGIRAADLAASGFTANESVLEGRWGFFQILGGGFEPMVILGSMGNPHSIVDPGVSVKPYPCGVLGHPSMDAMLDLVVEHDVKPDQIERIRLRAGSNILEPLRYRTARTALEAKFCIPFMLASIAIRRSAGIHEFTDEFVASEPVQALMARAEPVHDSEVEARGYDRIRSVVEVHLKDGRRLVQASAEEYRGGPARPLSTEELERKFSECASLALPEAKIAEALRLIGRFEELSSPAPLVAVLCEPSRPGVTSERAEAAAARSR